MSEPASVELEARTRWSLAVIGELVNSARRDGWLDGQPCEVADPDAMRRHSPLPTPMTLAAERLALTCDELDLLWLLACTELDPRVARAAQLLIQPGMNEISAQLAERLVGRGRSLKEDVLERLSQMALVRFDFRIPLHRRVLALNPRVLDLARGQFRLDRSVLSVARLDAHGKNLEGRGDVPHEILNATALDEHPLIVTTGVAGSGRATVLRGAINAAGRSALVINTKALVRGEIEHDLRAIARECRIHAAWPLFLEIDALGDQCEVLEATCEELSAPIFGTAAELSQWRGASPRNQLFGDDADRPGSQRALARGDGRSE